MIISNLKLTWKVLKRRKLFTFISLFGITFTLTILMVGASFFDFMTNSQYPEKKQGRILYLERIEQYEGKNGNSYTNYRNGTPGYFLLDEYISKLKTPEKISIYSFSTISANSYINNKRVELKLRFSDEAFWDILDFGFIEGKPFVANDVKNKNYVAVISQATAQKYFGNEDSYLGRYIEANNTQYKVVGVVKNVPVLRVNSYADIWVPISTSKDDFTSKSLAGSYAAILLARSSSDFESIREECAKMITKVVLIHESKFHLEVYLDTYLQKFVRATPLGVSDRSGISNFYALLSALIILFMLLPAINLINLNVTRLMERSSEIGARRSFGATRKVLLSQFIVENLILTFLGGILAYIFSMIILKVIQFTGVIPYAEFNLNLRVLLVGLGFIIFFGLLSGILPAYRMSRLKITEVMNGGEL